MDRKNRSSYPLDNALGVISQPSIYFSRNASRDLLSQFSTNVCQGLPHFFSIQLLRLTKSPTSPSYHRGNHEIEMRYANLGEVTGQPVLGLLQRVALTICQCSIYRTLQQPNSQNSYYASND